MDLSALMKDLKKIDPNVRVSVRVQRGEGASLSIPILSRTIKYDANGKKISDITVNRLTGKEISEYSTGNTRR